MTRLVDSFRDIGHEAAEWVIRRDRGLSSNERTAFETWLANPKHREEFVRIASSWTSLDRLSPASPLSAAGDAILSRARARQSRRHRITVMAGGLLAAAAMLVVGFFAGLRPTSASADHYQVLASASQEINLPDGSIATLNGDSRIETDYTPGERRIRLVQGEALFTVAKAPNRPFYVTAGPITVRAVGTAFNVRMGASAVEVLVTEGRVRVNDSTKGNSLLPPVPRPDESSGSAETEGVLTAGQRMVVSLAAVVDESAQVRIAAVTQPDIDQSLAWQTTRLVFNDTRLDEVVAAFNHYNRRQLVISEQGLGELKITGVFRANNLDGFIRLLDVGSDVKSEANGDREIVLSAGR